MKEIRTSIILLVLCILSCSCNKSETPDPTPGIHPCVLQTLTGNNIAGTYLGNEIDLAGLVLDAKSGNPIQGVPVTDGYTYVKTDKNGVYQMKRNSLSRKVYYSTPSAYEIRLSNVNHLPEFFSEGTMQAGKKYRVDFLLTPLDAVENEITFIMVGDPQCATTANVSRYVGETIKDLKSTIEKQGLKNVYAMTLGDIIHDSNDTWPPMRSSMSNFKAGGKYVPFFQTIGNHDHNALAFDDSDDSTTKDYKARANFVNYFGPNDYSFDRGDVHVVVLDDVMPYGSEASSKSNKKTCKYNAGLYDAQYNWLKQDISMVGSPAGKTIFICMHIPVRGTTSNHMGDILSICTQFKEAHLMIGHTHYDQNYIHTAKICKGGLPVYEHIHGSACGGWWACNSNVTGAPNGYTIYKVVGGAVKDWKIKGTGRDENFQMRVYDGNQTYTGTNKYNFNWYNPSNKGGSASITVCGNALTKGCFVAELFDDDNKYCKVEYWQNGKKVGDFTRLSDGSCANVAACSYFFNELNKNSTSWASKTASHYWYYKPQSEAPYSEKNWEVRATRTIPSSNVTHSYSVTKLTTDYSDF